MLYIIYQVDKPGGETVRAANREYLLKALEDVENNRNITIPWLWRSTRPPHSLPLSRSLQSAAMADAPKTA